MKLQFVSRPCPICGSTDDSRVIAESNLESARLDEFAFASRKLPEYLHARLIECPQCRLLYANPGLDPQWLATAYQRAAYDSTVEARYAAQTYARFLPWIIRRTELREGALDIGAGDGAFLRELAAAGFTGITGIEPSSAPIEAALPDIRPLIRQEMFQPGQRPADSLGLVTCFQTIEHLSDPLAMCRDAFRILKPGGAIFLVAHNRRALSARLLGRRSPIFDIEHLQLFCPASIRRLLAQAGFTDIRVTSVWNRYPLRYWSRLFPFPAPLKSRLLAWLKHNRVGALPLTIPAGNLAAIGFKQAGG